MSEPRGGTDALRDILARLRALTPATSDAERIDQIRLLEEVKGAAAAAQAAATAAFAASRRAAHAVAGLPKAEQGRGVAEEVALARRISPHAARRYVGWAVVLTTELPQTFAALHNGQINEWRGMLVARETIFLSRAGRAEVDATLAGQIGGWGDARVEAEVKKLAYRLDPVATMNRVRGAESDRRVGIRPAPDTMCRLTGLLPVAQGVAAYAALRRDADSRVAQGDGRSRGQIMADLLVERVTGQSKASEVPVEVNVVLTDEGLLAPDGAGGDEPGHLIGFGPIPAGVARHLAMNGGGAPRWLRRLYRHPETGELAAVESRRRLFNAGQRRFVDIRDTRCRTPWCDAPIRHIDHVIPAASGAPTSLANAQGLCAGCNYAKQAPGWRAYAGRAPGEIVLRTPTGHEYPHRPPELLGGRAMSHSGWLHGGSARR